MVNSELLGQVDLVLDVCGRPTAPEGTRFVDLPYVIPFHCEDFVSTPPVTPQQQRVKNSTGSIFLCRGIVFESLLGLRIKWPSGRYLSQTPSPINSPIPPGISGTPLGTGGNMLTLDSPERVEPGANITVEISGENNGPVDVQFWGVIRCFMSINAKNGGLQLMPDPVLELESRRRYLCGPPQNIMAPEWLLGNQCLADTPDGFEDESFTFFSPVIAFAIGQQVFNTAVLIPGGSDVVVKRVRALATYSNTDIPGGGATPVFAMRLPSGYSLTGGDMVPAPIIYWWPWLPSVRIPAGQRIIVDVSSINPTGSGNIKLQFEFDAVKRRKKVG